MNRVITLSRSDDETFTLTELGGGRHRLQRRTANGDVWSEEYGPYSARALVDLPREQLLGLVSLAAGDGEGGNNHGRITGVEVSEEAREELAREGRAKLARISRGLVTLAAQDATDDRGYLDETKIAAYAQERGIGFIVARQQLEQALSGEMEGEAEADTKIRERMKETGASYADAASALANEGGMQ